MKLENPTALTVALDNFWMPFTANRQLQADATSAGSRARDAVRNVLNSVS